MLFKDAGKQGYYTTILGQSSKDGEYVVSSTYRYYDYQNYCYYALEENGWTKYDGDLLEESIFIGLALGNLKNQYAEFEYVQDASGGYYYIEKVNGYDRSHDYVVKLVDNELYSISFALDGYLDFIEKEYITITYTDVGTTKITMPTLESYDLPDGQAKINGETAKRIAKSHYLKAEGVEENAEIEVSLLNENPAFEIDDLDLYYYVSIIHYKRIDENDILYSITYCYKLDYKGNIMEFSLPVKQSN